MAITLSEARQYCPNLVDVADTLLTGILEVAHRWFTTNYVVPTTLTTADKYVEAQIANYVFQHSASYASPYQSETLGDWSYSLKSSSELAVFLDTYDIIQGDREAPQVEKAPIPDYATYASKFPTTVY